MDISFDKYNRAETPSFILCNPDKTQIFSLDMIYNTEYIPRFNAMNDFNFTISKTDNGEEFEVYDFIKNKRIVLVDGLDYLEIIGVDEDMDGETDIKNVKCRSLEVKSIGKKLVGFKGTYQFYDPISPSGTLLGEMLERLPTWSVAYTDPSLWVKFRTFDVDENNIYNFLMEDVETAYECIFEFDTINSEISAYTKDSATTLTDIYLSFDNLIKSGKITEVNEEITTCLDVSGSGNLDIRTVNPLGGNKIYDFSYYATIDWMTQDLVDAIGLWDAKIVANQTDYANNLSDLKTYNETLVAQQVELVELENDYLALEGLQKVRIEANATFSDITVLMEAKQAEIDAKEGEIATTQGNIDNVTAVLEAINTDLSFETNFTESQITTLSEFIFENTYRNENFIQTDIMTQDEIQETAQDLYDQGVSVLGKLSQPRYEFEIDGANFLLIKEYEEFGNQLVLGAEITVELSDGTTTQSNILEISMSYDNPEDFSMTMSNRLRLDNESFTFSDLIGETVKTGNSVVFGKEGWNNWENNYKDEVSTFITSALDTTVNNVINAENQEIIINQNGLRARRQISEGVYSDNQMWMTSDVLALTRDNWETASAALGRIDVNGTEYYGLIADVVVGRLLAGNQLSITNENNNFLLDSTGAFLTDATLYFETSNNKNRISIDPTQGILIESNPAGTWEDQFKVDSSGNVIFSGNLQGASGTFSGSITAETGEIGGWHINSNSLYDDHSNYIRSNGQIKLGGLLINGTTARFDGDIYADKLIGQVVNTQVAQGVSAWKVDNGQMSGARIDTGQGAITGNWNFKIDATSGIGIPTLTSDQGVAIRYQNSASHQVLVDHNILAQSAGEINLNSTGSINFETNSSLNISVGSSLRINNYSGSTANVSVGGVFSAKTLIFYKGIFTGWGFA